MIALEIDEDEIINMLFVATSIGQSTSETGKILLESGTGYIALEDGSGVILLG